jgi:endonuclease/exonuclease/phosphatase family metal-dependent hydrolase
MNGYFCCEKQKLRFMGTILRKLVRNLNLLLVILTLLSYFAPKTPPDKSWLLIFLGLGYPWLLLANFLCLVFWIFKWDRWAWLSGITLLLGIGHIPSVIGMHPIGETVTAAPCKVLTYNINYLELNNFRKSKAQAAVKMNHFIETTAPDVICLQESAAGPRNWEKNCTTLPILRNYPFYTLELTNQVNIASKKPILAHGNVPLFKGNGSNGCTFADIEMGNQTIRFYALHLQSNKISMMADEVAKTGDVQNEKTWFEVEKMLRIVKKNTKIRATQARQVKDHILKSPYPVVVLGDFNDNPMSHTYHIIADKLKDGFRAKAFGRSTTYSGSIPGLKIDHILTSPSIDFMSYEIVRVPYSDHYPTIAQLHF